MEIRDILGASQASASGLDLLQGNKEQSKDENQSTSVYSWKNDTVSFSGEALARSQSAGNGQNSGEQAASGGGGGASGASAASESKLQELQSRLQSLQSQLAALQSSENPNPGAMAAIQGQIAQVMAEIASLTSA